MEGSLAADVFVCGFRRRSESDRARRSLHMPATGELIRLMNYVDDISATLRRISSTIGTMTAEEKKRLSEYMRVATNGFNDVLTQLEKQ